MPGAQFIPPPPPPPPPDPIITPGGNWGPAHNNTTHYNTIKVSSKHTGVYILYSEEGHSAKGKI